MTDSTLHVDGVRDCAQGEIFLLTRSGDALDALVYNTTGFGPCPAEEFAAIDVDVLAEETGSDLVWKNPRRFWMMDAVTIELVGEPRAFGGVQFNFVAHMTMPAGFDVAKDQSSQGYHPMQIRRVTTYWFTSGRPVQLLRSPDGITWVMQTYTDHLDPTLTAAALPTLGDRLALPEGWTYKAKTLDRDLTITTTGLAHIVSDDLANMYQGCVDGVENFDPWD